jgi:hypothetical protein
MLANSKFLDDTQLQLSRELTLDDPPAFTSHDKVRSEQVVAGIENIFEITLGEYHHQLNETGEIGEFVVSSKLIKHG